MEKTSYRSLTASELVAFCSQLAMILKAGIPVAEGLSIMLGDTHNAQGRELLAFLLARAESGEPLHLALKSAGCFPDYLVDMAEIGAQSGRLDEVMADLSDYYEREEAISKSMKSAVAYPLVMIVIMLAVIGVLIVRVLPVFAQVFVQLGTQMTGFPKQIMDMGASVGRYSVAIVVIVVVLLLGIVYLMRSANGRARLHAFCSSFAPTRRFFGRVASGRFASAMALMLASGLDSEQSLDMAARLVQDPIMREKLSQCKHQIEKGTPFATALEQTGIFSGVYSRMLAVGFRVGATDVVMKNLAERYQEELDAQIDRLLSMLEPSLVAVFSVIVGMILLSVMLPLMGIMSSIG